MSIPEYRSRYQLIAPNSALASYDGNSGLKKFELTAEAVEQTLVQGVTMRAWGYNGGSPGPLLVAWEQERVQVVLRNRLPEPTAIHWRGLAIPNEMDGFPPISVGPLVQPGEEFTYEFIVRQPGTYLYHAHVLSGKQEMRGLAGMMVVLPLEREPVDRDYAILLQSWSIGKGLTIPGLTQNQMDWISQKNSSQLYDLDPLASVGNYFTLNGKVFPDTAPMRVKAQERIRIRIGNSSTCMFPMHLHGHIFQVVAADGNPLPSPVSKSTICVGPGETWDIMFIANNPGTWAFHCNNPRYLMNPQNPAGGMLTTVRYVAAP